MLTFCNSKDENSNCIRLLGTATPNHEGGLISDNVDLISVNTSLISSALANGGLDSCSFYSGPSDAQILAFGESAETCGSIAYSDGSETCGSIAYSGSGETCGSVASSSCGTSFGGGCSYSC